MRNHNHEDNASNNAGKNKLVVCVLLGEFPTRFIGDVLHVSLAMSYIFGAH